MTGTVEVQGAGPKEKGHIQDRIAGVKPVRAGAIRLEVVTLAT